MKTTKVRQTEHYTDSQGEHIVCRGKLIIVSLNGQIANLQPLIISETEEIEVGNKIFANNPGTQELGIFTAKSRNKREWYIEELSYSVSSCRKILALPEHFSPKQLQAIVDGKLRDGDEVFVECESIGPGFHAWYEVELTNNHIKLFPVKQQEESWNDILLYYKGHCHNYTPEEFCDHLSMYYHLPKRK